MLGSAERTTTRLTECHLNEPWARRWFLYTEPHAPRMPADHLPNYLQTYRKNCGFSQEEIAWLLGTDDSSTISHHERARRTPDLRGVFAYELIFDTPAHELFAGVFATVERATRKRMRVLLQRLIASGTADPRTAIKINVLRAALESSGDPASGGDA